MGGTCYVQDLSSLVAAEAGRATEEENGGMDSPAQGTARLVE